MSTTDVSGIPSPYSTQEAEHLIIGALLVEAGQDRELDSLVFGRIQGPEYFSVPELADVFDFIMAARRDGRPYSFPAVGRYLHEKLGKRHGSEVIGKLLTWYNHAWDGSKIGGSIREFWRRNLMDAIQTIVEANAEAVLRELNAHGAELVMREDGTIDLMASLDVLERDLSGLREQVAWSGGDCFKPFSIAVGEALDNISRSMRGEPVDAVMTGLADLDALTGGMVLGELTVVGARPAMGKTTFAMELAVNAARNGHGVCVFSLEMSADRLAERMLSAQLSRRGLRVPYRDLRGRRAASLDRRIDDEIISAQDEISNLPISISERAGLTPVDIRSMLLAERRRMEAAGHRLRLVVIDYLGLLRSTLAANSKALEIAEITRELKETAALMNVAVLLLSQLNRGVESREDKRPGLHDLRDSGAIEQDAAQVLFLFREEYYLEKVATGADERAVQAQLRLNEVRNSLEVIVAKNRFGPTGSVRLFADMATATISDMARRWPYEEMASDAPLEEEGVW